MSLYYITPVCRIISADNDRLAREAAKRINPKAKATLIQPTGVVSPDYANPSYSLDTYA